MDIYLCLLHYLPAFLSLYLPPDYPGLYYIYIYIYVGKYALSNLSMQREEGGNDSQQLPPPMVNGPLTRKVCANSSSLVGGGGGGGGGGGAWVPLSEHLGALPRGKRAPLRIFSTSHFLLPQPPY